jgi:hypothetical protein
MNGPMPQMPETSSCIVDGMVSTIIPVYNRPRQLTEAVASVLAQDHRPLEVIVVDDGSTDNQTLIAAHAIADAEPELVRVVSQRNAGPGMAREHGRRLARGEFIQYLDSDDVLLPGKFTAQVAALRADPEAAVAYGITLLRDEHGRLHETPHRESGMRHDRMFPRFLNQRWWNTSTPLYRAAACAEAGPWTDLRLEEDWEYDCRIASRGGKLAWVPVPVSEHRNHAGPRLCVGDGLDPVRLAMRAQAQSMIWGHAKRADLPRTAPSDVATFARSLFLLSRQCGAAGLDADAARLLALAGEAAASVNVAFRDLAVYRSLARWLGHRALGRASVMFDAMRNAGRGSG